MLILGPPNAGKSTLINLLADRRVAITSPVAGTTRDLIQTQVTLNGHHLVVSDTAGVRETTDEIEKEGIEVALSQIAQANAVFIILDIKELGPEGVLSCAKICETI